MLTMLAVTASATLAPVPAVAVSTGGAELESALHRKPNLDNGAEMFETCAACHGSDGHGTSDGSVPAIAGQSVPVIVKEILEFRSNARYSIRMRHFVTRHHLETPQAIADVAAYVSSLPPREPVAGASGPRGTQGATVFANLCAGCHGRQAEGNPAARVPRLAAQHPTYLAEQLHDAAEGGRPSMRRDHARLLMRIGTDEIAAIAEYVAGIAPVGNITP